MIEAFLRAGQRRRSRQMRGDCIPLSFQKSREREEGQREEKGKKMIERKKKETQKDGEIGKRDKKKKRKRESQKGEGEEKERKGERDEILRTWVGQVVLELRPRF